MYVAMKSSYISNTFEPAFKESSEEERVVHFPSKISMQSIWSFKRILT